MQVKNNIVDCWQNPMAVKIEGDRRTAAKIVDGVLLEVSAYGKNYRNFRAATPKAGEKLFIIQEPAVGYCVKMLICILKK